MTKRKAEIMTKSDLIYNIGNASLSELLPLEKIQIDADVKKYTQMGYPILTTYMDFIIQYPAINPQKHFLSSQHKQFDGLLRQRSLGAYSV